MEDLNWEASDASYLSAWLQPMLVTNPKARATAAQSAHHPFLELMDEEMVEEEEIQGTSSSSETARIHLGESAQREGALGGEIEDQGARLLKLETFFVGEISRLEAKVGQVEEAKEAERVGYKARHPTTKFDCRLTVVWVSTVAHVSFLVLCQVRSPKVTLRSA